MTLPVLVFSIASLGMGIQAELVEGPTEGNIIVGSPALFAHLAFNVVLIALSLATVGLAATGLNNGQLGHEGKGTLQWLTD